MLCPVADKPPMPSMPLTPDYGGPVVSYAVIHKSVCEAIFLISAGNFMLCTMADVPPIPLTPDYGGPVVSYADGILDVRFISVREGKQSRISLSS